MVKSHTSYSAPLKMHSSPRVSARLLHPKRPPCLILLLFQFNLTLRETLKQTCRQYQWCIHARVWNMKTYNSLHHTISIIPDFPLHADFFIDDMRYELYWIKHRHRHFCYIVIYAYFPRLYFDIDTMTLFGNITQKVKNLHFCSRL